MKRLLAKIEEQRWGLTIGVLSTAVTFGVWIWLKSVNWNIVQANYQYYAAAIRAGATRSIEVPAWVIVMALPLAGVTVAGILQFLVSRLLGRMRRWVTIRQ
ncbi:MAG TPA: hypothetical protein VMJ32_12055 [Pirellulales bacterium]|nr:hypothetical protein [Pirellulales bacterium]